MTTTQCQNYTHDVMLTLYVVYDLYVKVEIYAERFFIMYHHYKKKCNTELLSNKNMPVTNLSCFSFGAFTVCTTQ